MKHPVSTGQVVVIQPGFFSAGFSGVISLVMRRPLVYIVDTPFCAGGLGKLWIRLTAATRLSFEHCQNPDSGYFYGDKHDTAGAVAEWLCDNTTFGRFPRHFGELEQPERKLRIIVRAYVDRECHVLTHLLGYLSGQTQIDHTILVGESSLIQRRYLARSGFVIRCVRPPVAMAQLVRFCGRTASRCRRLLRRLTGGRRSASGVTGNADSLPGQIHPAKSGDTPVLFFPHQTVSYGGLFYKDQFYNELPTSPFHSSRMLHVEIDTIKQSAITPALKNYYEEKKIRYCYLPRVAGLRLFATGVRSLINGTTALCSAGLFSASGRQTGTILSKALFQYRLYRKSLDAFPTARIALIGYEVLFPKMLYLALESKGVKTVASQERFHVSVFFDNWNYLLHTYFCSSHAVAGFLRQARYKHIDHLIPTGFVRTDLLFEYRQRLERTEIVAEASHFSKLVVLFDTPVFTDYNIARLMYVANWRCNKAYYLDVLALAAGFPDTLFVIRCKDILWIDSAEFSQTVKALDAAPNVIINREYDQHAFQYQLAAVADLVISKYSSIGDECLSVGIPMIFHDYTAIQTSSAFRTFDYNGYPVFAHSYRELAEKTKLTLERGQYLTDTQRVQVAALLNDRIADGQVSDRIQQGLASLYDRAGGSA